MTIRGSALVPIGLVLAFWCTSLSAQLGKPVDHAIAAQVTVSQPRSVSSDEKVPCPMQLDIPLGSIGTTSLAELPVGRRLVTHAMQKYVCHTERISGVTVAKEDEHHGRVHLSITTTVSSEQWRQDVDLTVALLDSDGKPVCEDAWKDLTVGKDRAIASFTWVTMASSTKTPQMNCRLDSAKLAGIGPQPTLRIVLSPKLDPDDKESPAAPTTSVTPRLAAPALAAAPAPERPGAPPAPGPVTVEIAGKRLESEQGPAFAWVLTIRNNSPGSIAVLAIVQLVDTEGFEVAHLAPERLSVEASSERVFRGTAPVAKEVADRVARLAVKLQVPAAHSTSVRSPPGAP
jgi:hypothetical protein